MKQTLKRKLQSTPFSFNLDEATNNAQNKIVNVVVRYFDGDKVKTEHFASKVVNQATSENIHQAVKESMSEELTRCQSPILCHV